MQLLFVVVGRAVEVKFICEYIFFCFQTRSGVDLQLVDQIFGCDLQGFGKVAIRQIVKAIYIYIYIYIYISINSRLGRHDIKFWVRSTPLRLSCSSFRLST